MYSFLKCIIFCLILYFLFMLSTWSLRGLQEQLITLKQEASFSSYYFNLFKCSLKNVNTVYQKMTVYNGIPRHMYAGIEITSSQRTATAQKCLLTEHFLTSPVILTDHIW